MTLVRNVSSSPQTVTYRDTAPRASTPAPQVDRFESSSFTVAKKAPVALSPPAQVGPNPTPEQMNSYALELKDYALSLAGTHDAAQIQTLVMQKSLDLLATNHPNMSNADLMDHAMALSTAVLVGKGQLSNLETIDASDPMVALLRGLPDDAYAGDNLASAHGTLRGAFDDGTQNQAFHCFFFVAAAYVAGGDAAKQDLVKAGNFKHEAADVGPSQQDYVASHDSIELGVLFSQMRGVDDRSVAMSMPALISGTMSETNDPATERYVIAGQAYDFTDAAAGVHDYMTQRASDVGGSLSVGVVNALNAVRDFFGIPH